MNNQSTWKTSESILWNGKPDLELYNLPFMRFFYYDHFFFIPWLEKMDYKSPVLTLMLCILLGTILQFCVDVVIHLTGVSEWIVLLYSFIAFVLLFLLLTYLERKTQYAFSEKTIFFKIPTIFGSRMHTISFENIKQITADHGSNGKSTIYFILKAPTNFRTMDLEGYRSQHYPTFEKMTNGRAVYAQLMNLQKEHASPK